ncbi:hypothetical protein JR316_0011525 [Psilocybe cubensis]|uniref:Uncharacterized protein n=1 Tax=Psilocybe cubensis TaxID=181762 RepID=A0ACB8GJS6_PSICU|nr:hypothetical protein JR316_0011525 [Psilocybe cubensis]KAH9475960.1 hypothetical protein JR316_0011525 [Psilocybe cubensis]
MKSDIVLPINIALRRVLMFDCSVDICINRHDIAKKMNVSFTNGRITKAEASTSLRLLMLQNLVLPIRAVVIAPTVEIIPTPKKAKAQGDIYIPIVYRPDTEIKEKGGSRHSDDIYPTKSAFKLSTVVYRHRFMKKN